MWTLLIIIGGLTPSALLLPKHDLESNLIILTSSWQIPVILLCSIVSGTNVAIIASISYITIGLFFLPIFHGGGSLGYIFTPEFGYIVGFIFSALVVGDLFKNSK